MSKAYVYEIKNKIKQEFQSSPEWVISFVRWSNRDTKRFNSNPGAEKGAPDQLETRDVLVVRNDCISVAVNSSKASHTPEAQLVFRAGDINYMTAIAPGDFFFVNMLKYGAQADEIESKAKAGKPINKIQDGFKGFFKVQSVRQSLLTEPSSGLKSLTFQITGFAFTEFNNTIYFNPHLLEFGEKKNDFLFVSNLGNVWNQLVGTNKLTQNVERIVSTLIDVTIGSGINRQDAKAGQSNFNTHFYVPQKVGRLLGVPNAKAAKDLIRQLLGIQKYGSGSSATLQSGMQPSVTPCQGSSFIKAEYWNQVSVWSIISQYTNAPINEIYNCFRVQSDGSILPTFVMRQMPFSTELYDGECTRFLNIPRWKINPEQISSLNIGKDEAARINFVQVFGRIQGDNPDALISEQIGKGNYDLDIADVSRSGLKPYIITSNFDSLEGTDTLAKSTLKSPIWAKLLGDALVGGHLKLNGTVVAEGIVEPICIGDNFELGNVIYHIESVTHSAEIRPDGQKTWSTTLQLSNGIDKNYTKKDVRYAQNDNVDMLKERKSDFKKTKILPGVSDSQSISRLSDQENVIGPENKSFNLQTKSKPEGKD